MECPSCGAANLEGKKFCGDCGTPLRVHCTACGAENPPGKVSSKPVSSASRTRAPGPGCSLPA